MSQTRPVAPSVSELAHLEEVWDLARPVVAATERLRTVVEELKVERTRAVGDLRRAVLNLSHDCPRERRAELARVLYWRHTEVPISDITVAFGYDQSTLLGAVGTVRTRATCEDCDATLVASTRRQLTELEKRAATGPSRFGPPVLCRVCRYRRDTAIYNEPPDEAYDDDPEAWAEDCYHDAV
ncbi:MAG: hypothetical protein ACRDYF_06365 [Acidimicrobiia bacterium]